MRERSTAYGPCPRCQALNLHDRRVCYRCASPLPTGFWLACRQGAEGGLNGYRPQFSEARRHPRHEVDISLELAGSMTRPHIVTVRNVSYGGLQFVSQDDCAIGARVWLYVPLRPRHIHAMQGIVRYAVVRQQMPERIFACGVEFQEPDAAVSQIVSRMIEQARSPQRPGVVHIASVCAGASEPDNPV